MRYTVSALARDGAPVQRLVDALIARGVARARIAISPLRLPEAPAVGESLVTVETASLDEEERLAEALAAAGGQAVQSAEESSTHDAI